jgi:hypothetical protein
MDDETVDHPVPVPMSPAERAAALKRRQDESTVKDNICFSTQTDEDSD